MIRILSILLTLSLIVNVLLSLDSDMYNFTFLTPFKYIILLIIGAIAIFYIKNNSVVIRKDIFMKLLIVMFFLMIFFGTLFSADPWNSMIRGLYMLIIFFDIYFLVGVLKFEKIINLIFNFFLFTGVIIALISDYYILIGDSRVFEMGNFKSIFVNANTFGALLALFMLPATMWKIKSLQNKLYILASFLLFSNLVFLLILTHSRAAILSFAIIVFFFIYFSYFKWSRNSIRNFTLLSLGTFVILISLFNYGKTNLITGYFMSKYEFQDTTNVFSTREALWNERLKGIEARLYTGWGYGINSRNYLEQAIDDKTEKGNTILSILEEFGIFIGSLIVLIMTVIVFSLFRKVKYLKNNFMYMILLVIVLSSLIHVNFESWLFYLGNVNAFVFWIMLISLMNYSNKNLNKHPIEQFSGNIK